MSIKTINLTPKKAVLLEDLLEYATVNELASEKILNELKEELGLKKEWRVVLKTDVKDFKSLLVAHKWIKKYLPPKMSIKKFTKQYGGMHVRKLEGTIFNFFKHVNHRGELE